MRSVGITLLLFAAFLFAIACDNPNTETARQNQPATSASPSNTASAVADELAAARDLFKVHCSKCHGENGAGGRVEIEGKQLKVPNLTGEHARKPSDEKLAAKITNGDDEMPAFKDKLSAEQIHDLVHFIRKEFQGK
jgi:cytochrome c6